MQNRIVGSSADYRLKFVGGVDRVADGGKMVGYNGEMKKDFTIKNVSLIESSIMRDWINDSREFKRTMWGLSTSLLKEVAILESLFEKYKSNVPKNVKLYRRMSITESEYAGFGFNSFMIGDEITPDELAISSFSYDKNTAYEYAEKTGKSHKIGYIMSSNNGSILDITDFSAKSNEKETILAKSIWYRIDNIKEFKTEDGLWKILKISPVE